MLAIEGRRNNLESYDNQAFSRGTSISSRKAILDNSETSGVEIDVDEGNIDEDSFRSDLERDSIGSMAERQRFRQYDDNRPMNHELRYEELQVFYYLLTYNRVDKVHFL